MNTINIIKLAKTTAAFIICACLIPAACSGNSLEPPGEEGNDSGSIETPEKPDDHHPDVVESITALRNPNRGYHIETTFIMPDGRNPFHPELGFDPYIFQKLIKEVDAEKDSITLTQQYFYLTPYLRKNVDETLVHSMEEVFDRMEKEGINAILRYAYNYEGGKKLDGETEERILSHIKQLTPFLRSHQGQIAALQSGFFGAWGEWHTSDLYGNQKAKNHIVSALLEAFPEPNYVLIRYPVQKRALKLTDESQRPRLGFNNDYFTAGQHTHAPENDYVGEDYEYVKKEAQANNPFIMGEMPYAEETEWGLHKILDPNKVLKVFNEHKYTAFDITQNTDLNIAYWKKIKVDARQLKNHDIRFDERYFMNQKGQEVSRSFYEFVRDHLGYRINLSEGSKVEVKDHVLKYDLTLTNSGFARPMFSGEAYLVVIKENEIVKQIKMEDEIMNWIPSLNGNVIAQYNYKGEENIGDLDGKIKIGIWIPKKDADVRYRSAQNIKMAQNDNITHWWSSDKKYAVNVIAETK